MVFSKHNQIPWHQDEEHLQEVLKMKMRHCLDQNTYIKRKYRVILSKASGRAKRPNLRRKKDKTKR